MTNLSSLIEILAKQALGAQQGQSNQQQSNQQQAQNSGLGGILGSVLGQVLNQQSSQQSTQQQSPQNAGLGGILGSVLGQLTGGNRAQGQTGSGKSALLVAVLPIVLAWIQKQGGIQGALDKLKNAGMSSQVNSWVSPEDHVENQQVKSEQVQNLFDEQEIDEIAQQTAEPKQNVYAAISSVLPQIIDSLTPDGDGTNKKEADDDIQQVLKSISNLMIKR